MTTHNGGEFLHPAVRSVLAQTRRDWELILVDNASTDGAVDALVAKVRDERVRVFRPGRNLHIAEGTNFAHAQSRGRYLAVVDHDDLAQPDRFERQVGWLDAHADYGGIASRTRLVDEADRSIGMDFTLLEADEHRVFTQFSQAANFGSHLFRRELFDRFPRRPAFPFSSDFDFVARANEAWPVAALPEVLFHYRMHARQATQRHRREQIAAECAIRVLTARRRAGRPENFEAMAAWLAATSAGAADAAAIYRAALTLCRAERWEMLAVYHARKLLSVARGPADVAMACRQAFAAMRTGAGRSQLMRFFFRGPLRTFQLRASG